jgi:hypothetical protein
VTRCDVHDRPRTGAPHSPHAPRTRATASYNKRSARQGSAAGLGYAHLCLVVGGRYLDSGERVCLRRREEADMQVL